MADPVSTAGLVLAIVPLLISAFENYEATFQPFVTYCRYVKEVERFRARLEGQRSIFLNECELLFMAVSNGTSFAEVFKDPNHPSRNDEGISERLETLLGSSCRSCVLTLNLINDTLNKMVAETKGLEDLLEDKTSRKAKGKSSWIIFRSKIKISFSKTRLHDSLDELRRYNEDLITHSRQMRELAAQRSFQRSVHTVTSKVVTHFQVVQKASERLHDILASKWSCDDRIEHVAGMSLNVEDAEKCRQSTSKLRFSLVLTCVTQNSASHSEPLWLKVESAPGDQADPPAAIDGMAADEAMLEAKLRMVRFAMPTSRSIRSTNPLATAKFANSVGPPDPLLDLCDIGRLCQYFQRQQRLPVSGEPCIGFLEKTKTFKHFVYPSPYPRAPATVTERRLREILQNDYDGRRQEAWAEKLVLARLLALAVLRFQKTSWLPKSWGSNDIAFYCTDESIQREATITSPYLNVKLSGPATRQVRHPDSRDTDDCSASSLSQNATLFSLGVVLIELGYDAPLQALRQEEDVKGGASTQFTDFFTAMRLSKLVSKRLNTRYGKLVQRCLACNFGVGTELEAPELQSAIVINVVNELDECLKIFDGFHSHLPSLGYPV